MRLDETRSRAAFASAAVLVAAAGGAHAGLPAPTISGYVALSALAYSVTLTGPGTEYLDPPIFVPGGGGPSPACNASGYCDYGTGVISATLGADPKLLLGATPANDGGGDSHLYATYFMEYQNLGAPGGTTIDALVHAGDGIVGSGDYAAQAIMTVSGVNGQVYLGYNCATTPDAAFGCSGSLPNAPFANAPVTLVDNTVYQIDLELDIYAKGPVQAQIDPYFTAPADGGGAFIFSPGVTTGVPEPAAWTMMLVGAGLAGRALRRRRGIGAL
jgi:PEP-CTERM motif